MGAMCNLPGRLLLPQKRCWAGRWFAASAVCRAGCLRRSEMSLSVAGPIQWPKAVVPRMQGPLGGVQLSGLCPSLPCCRASGLCPN
jgi:hypothetical protein